MFESSTRDDVIVAGETVMTHFVTTPIKARMFVICS
jgi:hypothetical protein